MAGPLFLLTEQMRDSVAEMVSVMHPLTWDTLPPPVRERIPMILHDLLVVARAGASTPEMAAILAATPLPDGQVPVAGTSVRTTPDQCAYWTAVAACALELDEGNKVAEGHPAAHVVPAAVAAALLSPRTVTGQDLLTAVAIGYEVAARFGHATRRSAEWHPHGHWGCTGAAAAVTHLLGGSSNQMAAAIDAAAGLMYVTPWETVLAGSFTRNLWVAGAVSAGLGASRLALAGVVENLGAAAAALEMVGKVDPARLTADVGGRWLLTEGYLKQHSSCSYTHAAVDLVLALRHGPTWTPTDVVSVEVRTTSLALNLLTQHPSTRMSAMFSLPFVVGNALTNGRVDPETMEPGSTWFARAAQASKLVRVEIDTDLDRHLPERRCTEVTLRLADGSWATLGQPNPVGDAAHFPLGEPARREKAARLLGPTVASGIAVHVDQLCLEGADARRVLLDLLTM